MNYKMKIKREKYKGLIIEKLSIIIILGLNKNQEESKKKTF